MKFDDNLGLPASPLTSAVKSRRMVALQRWKLTKTRRFCQRVLYPIRSAFASKRARVAGRFVHASTAKKQRKKQRKFPKHAKLAKTPFLCKITQPEAFRKYALVVSDSIGKSEFDDSCLFEGSEDWSQSSELDILQDFPTVPCEWNTHSDAYVFNDYFKLSPLLSPGEVLYENLYPSNPSELETCLELMQTCL